MIAFLTTLAFVASASAQIRPVPGWYLSGSNAKAFEIAVDRETFHGGSASATIRCREKRCAPFGTLSQSVRADRYLGRRVRLSAWVKASKASQPRLWMRVDGSSSEMLAFDNMDNRAKSGTFEWQRQEIVLEVMPPAVLIHFGLILGGSGQAWVDDVVIEDVEGNVKSTDRLRGPLPPRGDPAFVRRTYDAAPSAVVNGDFEQPAAPANGGDGLRP